jgi:hypothetical protein
LPELPAIRDSCQFCIRSYKSRYLISKGAAQSFFYSLFKNLGILGARLKHNIPAPNESCHVGKMKRFENSTQELHLDGTVRAGIDRSKKRNESGHLTQSLNQIPMRLTALLLAAVLTSGCADPGEQSLRFVPDPMAQSA